MNKNYSVKCNVTRCRHNCEGSNCCLDSISVTHGCGESCTCCGDYCEKE